VPLEPRSSREVFRGRLIRVVVEDWPEGEREIVHHPGAAAIVAFDGDDVVLVRQLRQSIRAEMLEIPAGVLDVDGEPPLDCAIRELREETGYVAASVVPLGAIHPSPGFSDERIDLFTGQATADGDPEEEIDVVRMPFTAALRAVGDGTITDGKTVAALLLAAGPRASRDGASPV
jgi:ADP-ribose pyrophosphatase